MDTKFIFTISLLAVTAVILAVLLPLVFKSNKKQNSQALNEPKDESRSTLVAILDVVSNKESSKNDVTNALNTFLTKITMPPKQNEKVTNEAKVYLKFILLLANHPKADAKLIAYMNNELKKRYPTYANEIDMYEEKGRSRRF